MHPTSKSLSLICCLTWCFVAALGCQPAEPIGPTNTTHSPQASPTTLPPTEQAPAETSTETESKPQEQSSKNTDPSLASSPKSEPKPEDAETKPTSTKTKKASSAQTSESKRPVPKPQPGKTIDLTFDDIKFDIEPDAPFDREMLPQAIEDLNGQKIRIGGYMLPSFKQRDIQQFVLVRDNMECCFGPGAALYDCILVEMEGRGIDFSVRPITVEGTFTIKEYKSDEGKHLAIYHMQGIGIR